MSRSPTAFLTASPLRTAKIGSAGTFLIAVVVFLSATTSESGPIDDVTTGLLWAAVAASLVLPVLVAVHAGYDLVEWVRTPARHDRIGSRTVVAFVLRTVECGLATVLLAVVGWFGSLGETQPGGQGAGAIAVAVVLVVAVVGALLAVVVIAGGVLDYAEASAG